MNPQAVAIRTIIDFLIPLLGPNDSEHHFVIDSRGKTISHLIGIDDEVDTRILPNNMLYRRVTVHQHPLKYGAAFPISGPDIMNALICREKASFVVGIDGIHRWTTRSPRPDEYAHYEKLMRDAETLEDRAAVRAGWRGGKNVSPHVYRSLPPAVTAEIYALVTTYPEFVTYTILPLNASPAELLP